jgi:SET domain-containing protein
MIEPSRGITTRRAKNQRLPSQRSERFMDPDLFRQSDAVEVRRVDNRGRGGRGVFAVRDIAKGEVFERVPVLLIPKAQVFGPAPEAQRSIRISWYVFNWLETKRGYVALSLGYGSIYNHSFKPCAAYEMEMPDIMSFRAVRDIAAGEEITIDYNGAEEKGHDLGFEVSDGTTTQDED